MAGGSVEIHGKFFSAASAWMCGLSLVLAIAIGSAPFSVLSAQGLTGQVSGSVRDPSGGAVSGALVRLTDVQTSRVREAKTNEAGDFVVAEVLAGTFNLRVEADRFRALEEQGIVLTSTDRLVLKPIRLELGALAQTVSVLATAALQTESAERSGLIDSREIAELSLKGRDYLSLAKLLPGVVDINAATREAPGGSTLQGIYINGNRQGSLNLTLDGISMMDTGGGTGPYMQPSIDAVAEIKVLLTNYQAEYGRASGGTINTITRSGTRNLHGGAYYYFRNEDLNANDFFANSKGLPRAQYRFNYPGYFAGGPVILPHLRFNHNHDKLFFFWSEEFLPRTYPSSVTFQTFPTALERMGDFSHSLDQNGKLITVTDPVSKAAFPGNIIPPSRIDPAGQDLLNIFPLPNAVDPTHTYDYVFQSSIQQPRNDQVLRIDWNISPTTQFYARGIKDFQATRGGFGFTLASPSWPQLPIDYEIHGEGIVTTLIHSFTPARVNELTFGVNRGKQLVAPLSASALDSNSRTDLHLNIPQFYPQANPLGVIPNATFAGVPDAPQLNIDGRFPYFGANSVWQISDNFSQVVGAHNLKAGVLVDISSKNYSSTTSFNGTFAFDRDANNPLDTGYAFSNALLGTVDSYTESTGHPVMHARDKSVEWYVQDTWRVAPRVTIDAGLRFYWLDPTISAGSQLAAFNPSLYSAAAQPPLVQPYLDPVTHVREGRDPVTGAILPVVKIGTFSTAAGTPNQGMQVFNQGILQTPPIQLAPRAGIAWDVFGDGRTAIRTGFGIYYDRFPENQIAQFLVEPPLVNTPVANYTTISSLLATPLSQSPNSVFGIQSNYRPPAVYNWSFGIQRSLGRGAVLDVAYTGDVSRHGMQYRDLNATNYGTNFLPSSLDPTLTGGKPLPANFLRPFPGYSSIQYMEFSSNSNYHALQAQLTRRLSSRLTFHASWTWSKVLDVADTPTSAVNPVLNYNSRNYGPASFDRRQNVAINFVYSLPRFSDNWNNRFSRQAFDGWEVSGILSMVSGAPTPITYTFVTATDITGASGVGIDSRVDLVCNPNLSWSAKSFNQAFNTACVTAPSKAELGIGDSSKYPFVGPGVENADLSMFKNFGLGTEARKLQFRFESYNALNHAQFTAVDSGARFDANGNQVNQQFGHYTAAAPSRRLVLGLKLYF